jgi:hypothetical protein
MVQTILSLRLVWANTAFPDEALYVWAGHVEWSHWLYGTRVPDFSAFFSGAPVIYPPLGAFADAWGGLAGARILSLGFILGASVLLHGVTRRMFGRTAGTMAVALWAGVSSIQYLGAFATYDAMALFLLTLSTWLGVRAVERRPAGQAVFLTAAAMALALADATKYAAALFTPVVLAVIALFAWWKRGRAAGIRAGSAVFLGTAGLLAAGLFLAGKSYWQGILTTTLARQSGSQTATFLLFVSGKWIGAVAVLAIIGAVSVGFRGQGRAAIALAWVLAGTVFLVPLEQARIHTLTSLFKHVGYGAWFSAILAGYCLASLPRVSAPSKAAAAFRVTVAAAVLAGLPSIPWAASHFGWPNVTQIIPRMRQVLASTNGVILADDRANVLDYYLPTEMRSRPVAGTFLFFYDDPASGKHLTGQPAYAAAVWHRYFSVIFLEFWDSAPQDRSIEADLAKDGGYRLVAKLPYQATGQHGDAMIWVRASGPR